MEGIHWVIRTYEQLQNLREHIGKLEPPFSAKIGPVQSPKTRRQIAYMHSLCNALAAHHQADPREAKKDAKVEFGVVIVSTSIITGARTARLKSFADYTKEEATAFISGMEAHLDENSIPYIRSED